MESPTRDSTHAFDLVGSLALLGGVLCWAVIPVFLRGLTAYVDPWVANGVRYPFAALLYWPVLVIALARGSLDRRVIHRALVPAGLSFCGQVLWALAPYYLPASLIGFLVKSAMVWAVAGSMILFPEERSLLTSRRFHAGLVLAALGFVVLARARGALDVPVSGPGVAIILGCSVFFGLYGVSVRQFLKGVPPLVSFGVVCQPIAAGTFTLMLLQGRLSTLVEMPLRAWGLLLLSSVIGIGISHVLFYTAIHRLGPSISTSTHLVSPFLTLAFGWIFLGERLTPTQWGAGSALVAGGALILLAQEHVRARRRLLVERERMGRAT